MSASFCNPGDSCDGQPETPHKNREMILVGRRFTERFAKAKRSVQEVESPMDHHVGASYVSLAPIYFISQSALAQLLLLFRKKSHSAHRPGCKRPPGGSLPLPTFCELEGSNPTIKMPKISFSCGLDKKSGHLRCPLFFCFNTPSCGGRPEALCRKPEKV